MKLLGSTRLRTTAYHLIATGLIKRFHFKLKAALKSYPHPNSWTDSLLMVLLGIQTALKQAVGCSTAELVYGTTLCLSSCPLPKYRTLLSMSLNSSCSCNNYKLHLLMHTQIVPPTSVMTSPQAHMFLYVGTQFANPCNNPMMGDLRYLNELISTSQWTSKVDRKLSQLTTLNLLISR